MNCEFTSKRAKAQIRGSLIVGRVSKKNRSTIHDKQLTVRNIALNRQSVGNGPRQGHLISIFQFSAK